MSIMEGAAADRRAAQGATGRRRRSPTNPKETARRKAWGREWGAIMSAHAKTYRPKG